MAKGSSGTHAIGALAKSERSMRLVRHFLLSLSTELFCARCVTVFILF